MGTSLHYSSFLYIIDDSELNYGAAYVVSQGLSEVDWMWSNSEDYWFFCKFYLGSIHHVTTGVIETSKRDANGNVITRSKMRSCDVLW